MPICYWHHTGTALYMTGTVGTVGTLVPATLFLCTNMLVVLHWYCSLYVLVLWVLLVHWYQPLYVSVPICYWYCTGTGLCMSWYCGYFWYIGTSHSMSLCLYVTGTKLVLLFICTGTVGTVGTLVPATLCLCTNMLLVLHWYWSLYVLVLWVLLVHWYQPLYVSVPICYWYCTGTGLCMSWYCGYFWYIGTSHSVSMCLYVTGTTLVLLFICTGTVGTVGTLVPATMSLYQYVTGTALILLFICTGTVGTLGTLVPATLCFCAYMLLVPNWYCSLYVLVVWVLLVHWYQTLYSSVPICYWYHTGTALYMYWYCGYCWYIGTDHSMSLCLYVTGTTLVLLFICTGTVDTLVPATLCLCVSLPAVSLCLLCLCACGVSVPVCLLCLYACVAIWLCVFVAVCSPYPFVHPVPAHLCMCTYYYYANEISLLSCK